MVIRLVREWLPLWRPSFGPNTIQWLRALDLKLSWAHAFRERWTIESSVSFFNVLNFPNFDLPPEL